MKRNFIGILILLAISTGETNAQLVNKEDYQLKIQKGRISKKGTQTFWAIPTTFTNVSKDTLKYFSMLCSWQEFYLADNEKMNIMSDICDKNVPVVLTLAPNKSKTVELNFLINQPIPISPVKFKVGFHLIPADKPRLEFSLKELLEKKNIIWSNIISI